MAEQGPRGAGTGASDSTVGTVAWTNPSNITSDDAAFSTAAGLFQSGGNIKDSSVKLVIGGSIVGSEMANGQNAGTTEAYLSYGGASSLWGVTPSYNDINDSTFGVVISLVSSMGAGTITHYLKATNFGFTIPSTAVVTGILMEPKVSYAICFTGDTLIDTPDGKKPIRSISIGDNVYAFDENTNEVTVSRVLALKRGEEDLFYTIRAGTHKVTCTPMHRFFTPKGYVAAHKLRPLDKVWVIEHGTLVEATVTGISVRIKQQSVYNFEVEGQHNYFANGFAVHNVKGTATGRINYVRCTITYTDNATPSVPSATMMRMGMGF